MPPRKPLRPDKNRDRGRFQHGARPEESGSRDNRSQDRKKPSSKERPGDRPRKEQRAVSAIYSAESETSKQGFDQKRNREGAQPGYKADGGSYWIYGNHAVLAAIDNPKRRIR